jgi:hypothetical protein
VAAYGEALKELTPEAAPYWRELTQQNLDRVMRLIAQRQGK